MAIPDRIVTAVASTARSAGRGTGVVAPHAASAARVGAVRGAAAVTVLWSAFHGCLNIRKYKKGQMSKQEALRDTASESVGSGVATGVGLAAGAATRVTALAATSSVVAPFLVATAVSSGVKVLWDRRFRSEPVPTKRYISSAEIGE